LKKIYKNFLAENIFEKQSFTKTSDLKKKRKKLEKISEKILGLKKNLQTNLILAIRGNSSATNKSRFKFQSIN